MVPFLSASNSIKASGKGCFYCTCNSAWRTSAISELDKDQAITSRGATWSTEASPGDRSFGTSRHWHTPQGSISVNRVAEQRPESAPWRHPAPHMPYEGL